MIVITCVDPGSANFLVPILTTLQEDKLIYTSGSATRIFQSAGISVNEIKESSWDELQNIASSIIEELSPELVICGTSWGLSLDKAITLATRASGVITVSTVDHWRLIKERFIDFENVNDKGSLPFLTDYIIVIDEKSKLVLENLGVDSDRILLGGNPHLEHIQSKYSNVRDEYLDENTHVKDILFVSEIIREDLPNHPYDEYQVLEDLVALSRSSGLTIDIKLHPNEKTTKFLNFLTSSINYKTDIDFPKMILEYKYIIGIDSMLLFEVSMCRSGVFSYRPNFQAPSDDPFGASSVVPIFNYEELERVLKNKVDNTLDEEYSYVGSASKVTRHIANLMEVK